MEIDGEAAYYDCPDYVQSIRAEAHKYLSVPLAGDVALSMRLS
jgi:hypothetical protein